MILPVVSSICAENVFSVADDKHHRAMSADAQLQMAEEPGVVVEEPDIRRAGRIDISGNIGGAEGLAVDQGKIVDLARLQRLEGEPRLKVRRRNLN